MTSSPTAPVLTQLRTVEELLGTAGLDDLSPAELPAVVATLRRIEGKCAALGIAVATRARRAGDDPSATLLGHGQVSGRQARQQAKRADTAQRMPELATALEAGRISPEHIDAVGRAGAELSGDEAALFDQLAPDLAEAATKLPVDTFARKVRTLVDEARADHGMTRLQQHRARSSIKMWLDRDGLGQMHITADAERFVMIQSAVEARAASLAAAAKREGESVERGSQLMLDALIDLLSGAQGSAARPLITVVVDQATVAEGPHEHTVCETDTGLSLPPQVVDRYLCDAVVRTVTVDDRGVPLDVGRRYRTATSAQWAALTGIYATCAWKHCDRPITWTQAHHIHEWEEGGLTDLQNLVPLCSEHHHAVHDDGWRLVMRADRTLEIHRPLPQHRHRAHHGVRGGPATGHVVERPPDRPGHESLWATTTPDRLPTARSEAAAA